MLRHFRQTVLTLGLVALASQLTLAQSADYFLEKVAIQARLMQAKAPLPMTGDPLGRLTNNGSTIEDPVTVFAHDLELLLEDVVVWKSELPAAKRQAYQDVRKGLQEHIFALRGSASNLQLSAEQDIHLKLLLLEVELASENIDTEFLRVAAKPTEARRRRDRARFDYGFGPAWNAWGGPWGGWGAWGAGPYFGQPFGPGFGPRCW